MRITLTRLKSFHHVADIRRLLLGIIVTVGLVVVLIQCFGIPCPKAFCLSPPVNVSVLVLTNNSNETEVSVVKTEMNYINLSDDDVVISKDKVLKWRLKDQNQIRIWFWLGVKVVEKVMFCQWQKRGGAVSISQMKSLLIQSFSSLHSPKPLWSSARDSEMLSARSEIEDASVAHEVLGLNSSIYRNISKFQRSYNLMEKKLKVYVYKEEEKPIFHNPKPRGIYASEGWFMKLMESNKKFVVKDPRKAHLFYIPISIQALRSALGQDFQTPRNLADHFKEYLDLIA